MKRIVWLTDIHLNFLQHAGVREFLMRVAVERPDAVVLSGDISESPDLHRYLREIAQTLSVPIYFVLGNHDYYFSSIEAVRATIRDLEREVANLIWLSEKNVIELSPDTGLIGHDGWADARAGDYVRSLVMLYDYQLIDELAGLNKEDRWFRLKQLGDEAAAHIRRVLPAALERFGHVLLLTHVPPWREACWYQGQISNDEWLPHFTCLAMGEAIEAIAREYPERKLTVLCGHTHSPGECHPRSNVTVLTGGAEYGSPQIQRVFEFD